MLVGTTVFALFTLPNGLLAPTTEEGRYTERSAVTMQNAGHPVPFLVSSFAGKLTTYATPPLFTSPLTPLVRNVRGCGYFDKEMDPRRAEFDVALRKLTPVFQRQLAAKDVRHELYGRDQLTWNEYERIGEWK